MAEVKWQARRTADSVLVDVTADVEGTAVVNVANAIEAGTSGTIIAPAGAEGTGNLLFEIQGETGFTILSVDPYGFVNIYGSRVDPTNGGAGLTVRNTQNAQSVFDCLAHDGSGGGGVMEIGFFGKPRVPQPAAPTTLADVIAALKALGLVAT